LASEDNAPKTTTKRAKIRKDTVNLLSYYLFIYFYCSLLWMEWQASASLTLVVINKQRGVLINQRDKYLVA
jgi:hypothetical protein